MDILPQIWGKLYIEVGKGKEQMLSQTINSVLFEDILKEYFAVSPSKMSTNSEDVQFTKDELNALRYASRYVPIVILKAFERIKDRKQKLEEFKICLGNMAVSSENDDASFSQYTSEWFNRMNRGSLYQVNDITFSFFLAMEKVTRSNLPKLVTGRTQIAKGLLIDLIASDEQV